jgi:LacI family transcriptional regulator
MGVSSVLKEWKVALLIETARGYGRGVLRGIVRYATLHGGWAFYITPRDLQQALPAMRQWGGTGIIARIQTPQIAAAIIASGLPTIALDLSEKQTAPGSPLSRFSELVAGSHDAGRMAAEHLLDKGFRHYAIMGVHNCVWSGQAELGYVERIAEAGIRAMVYRPPRRKRDRQWGVEQGRDKNLVCAGPVCWPPRNCRVGIAPQKPCSRRHRAQIRHLAIFRP